MQKKSVAFTVFDALAIWCAYCDSDHRRIAGLFYIIYLHNMLIGSKRILQASDTYCVHMDLVWAFAKAWH